MPSLSITGATSPYYLELIDYSGGTNPIYMGLAAPNSSVAAPVWLIKKITYDGNNNPTSIQFAGGIPYFNAIWNNRAALSYS